MRASACGQVVAELLWCRSLTHRYFCTNFSGPPKNTRFLIPLVETLLLVIRRYCIEDFLLASKLSEKISRADLSLAGSHIFASTTREKKGSSYPSCINTLICVLKRLYWQNPDITKTGREMMISWQTMVWTTKSNYYYWSKVRATVSGTRRCDLYLVELNFFKFLTFLMPTASSFCKVVFLIWFGHGWAAVLNPHQNFHSIYSLMC
jgi:hypothetical protein